MIRNLLARIAVRSLLINGTLPLMLVFGLLLAPVTCTCGASVPHGHSLFQLPHHHHGDDDQGHYDHDEASDHQSHGHHDSEFAHVPHPLAVIESECDDSELSMLLAGNFVLANALEHQDGAVLNAPPTSSFGQPMTIAQPALPTIDSVDVCETVDLPSTRTLEGTATAPETPPPQA